MQDKIITFDTALLAKKKGFNIMVSHAYSNEDDLQSSFNMTGESTFDPSDITACEENGYPDACFAPTQSLLQRWLREVHKIDFSIDKDSHNIYHITPFKFKTVTRPCFDTIYEQALEEGLQKALNLIK